MNQPQDHKPSLDNFLDKVSKNMDALSFRMRAGTALTRVLTPDDKKRDGIAEARKLLDDYSAEQLDQIIDGASRLSALCFNMMEKRILNDDGTKNDDDKDGSDGVD